MTKSEYFELHQKELFKNHLKVLSILNHNFGKENVGLKFNFDNLEILTRIDPTYSVDDNIELLTSFTADLTIYFPGTTTVVNEFGDTHDIYDMFILLGYRPFVGLLGSEKMYMRRATYTENEVRHKYCHSHASTTSNDLTQWNKCCYGYGMLNSTIKALCTNYNIHDWFGLCAELKTYIKSEHVSTGPYITMNILKESNEYYENLPSYGSLITATPIPNNMKFDYSKLKDTENFKYLFDEINGFIVPNMSKIKENSTILKLNKWLLTSDVVINRGWIDEYTKINNDLYCVNLISKNNRINIEEQSFQFKKKIFNIKILKNSEEKTPEKVTLLEPYVIKGLIMYLISKYNYEKTEVINNG